MRNGWRETTLGELFESTNERLGQHEIEPPLFSISKHEGVMPANAFFGKRVASTNLDAYKLLAQNSWVYSTIHIDEGSIARNTTGVDGVVSPMYTVMKWISEVDEPGYAELLVCSAEMLAVYSDNAQGSINRRRSLTWKAFRSIPIALPPLNEQRRIVDLIAAVDDLIDAVEAEAAASVLVRREAIDALLELHGGAEVAELGQLGTFERGKRFTKNDYVADGLGCIHYGQIYTDYGATASETVSFLPSSFRSSARLAHPGDLVIAGTGENVEAIGKAVAWMGRESVAVHDDAFIFRHSLDPVFASALFSSSIFLDQRAPSDSKVARLSAGGLANTRVPVVSEVAQRQIGALMIALDDSVSDSRATAEALRALRSNLLTVLLSGEHEIPFSYDALLVGEVA